MTLADEQYEATCQDTERSSDFKFKLTINRLPDEILLEIFESYRRIHPHFLHLFWREKYAWFNLAHVCRRWRAVIFASTSRLDLGITVGLEKPVDIKSVLSSPLPIFIKFVKYTSEDITRSALLRMRPALAQRDRVRGISFSGAIANLEKIFEETKGVFPNVESLDLENGLNGYYRVKLLDTTFLETVLRPDLSRPHLRRISLSCLPLAPIPGFLSSVAALTDLFLRISVFDPSQQTAFFTCFQGMACLRDLELIVLSKLDEFTPQPSTLKDIVPLSKLIFFRYEGHIVLLDALVAGLSAPHLRDVDFKFYEDESPPVTHLPRFINEIEEHYYAVRLFSKGCYLGISLLTQSEYISHCTPRFWLHSAEIRYSESKWIPQMSHVLSSRLTTVEEVRLVFEETHAINDISWRRFFQHLRCVKVLQTEGEKSIYYVTRVLCQDFGQLDNLSSFPALEEIDLGAKPDDEDQCKSHLAAFQLFVSARQQAGRPVNIFFRP